MTTYHYDRQVGSHMGVPGNVYYGPLVDSGQPVHDIFQGRVFRGAGPRWPGGQGVVVFINLQFYTETFLWATIGDSQVPQQRFLDDGWDVLAIMVPVARGGDSPIPADQTGLWDPVNEEYGEPFPFGNGCNAKGSGDASTWPGSNHTTNPGGHPLADPKWCAAHRAALDAIQWVRDNAAAMGWNPELIVPAGDSAGAATALWATVQPDRAGRLGGEGTQPSQSTRVAGCWAYRPGNVWYGIMADGLAGWPHSDKTAPDLDEPAATNADVDATELLLESLVRIGSTDPDYPTITDDNNDLVVAIGSASAMSAAAQADANRYVHPYPTKTETNTHSALGPYIAKSVWNDWHLAIADSAEDATAGSVTNGQAADSVHADLDSLWLRMVEHITSNLKPAGVIRARSADINGSVLAWLVEESLEHGTAVFSSGVRFDTAKLAAFAELTVEYQLETDPYGAPIMGTGIIDLDVRSARQLIPSSPTADDAGAEINPGLLQTTIDHMLDALQRKRIPVHNLADFQARTAPSTGTLQSAITADADSLVVVTDDDFDGGPYEITIGGERIEYTTRVAGSGTLTLSGLTRGHGTAALAHPAGAVVADALGEPLALIHTDMGDVRPLPYDVAEQRNRAIVRVPFRVTYQTPAT